MASNGNVRVVLRMRPLNEKEIQMGHELCVKFDHANKSVVNVISEEEGKENKGHNFTFDSVCDINTKQRDVYDIVGKPIVESVLDGFNGTILAYGQTSSGKTYTMQGNIDDPEEQGIIPRIVKYMFERIESSPETIEFTVKVSMVEIYMEKIKDLFNPIETNLKVTDDKAKGISIEGAKEHYVNSIENVFTLMREGNLNRAIGHTDMNAVSSRSHSIFIMTIKMNDTANYSCKVGKMFLVDLAGSEKIGKTNASGQTLDEAKNINKSLTMLGRVIHCLTEGATHIPYRDSKLTRILQDSLGGNSKTCLIITASPSPYNAEETLSTCRFGNCAKSIKNNAKINKEFTIPELKLYIQKLESIIEHKNNVIKDYEDLLNKNGVTPQKELNKTRNNISSEDNTYTTLPSSEEKRAIDSIGGTPKTRSEANTVSENLFVEDICKREEITSGNIEEMDYRLNKDAEKFLKLKMENKQLKIDNEIKKSAIKSLIYQNEDQAKIIEEQKVTVIALNNELCSLAKSFNYIKQARFQIETEFKSTSHESLEKQQYNAEQIKTLKKAIDDHFNIQTDVAELPRTHCKTMGYKEGELEHLQKISQLKRQLEQVTILYHQMIIKISDMSVKLQKSEMKLAKKSESTKHIEAQNKECKDQWQQLRELHNSVVKRLLVYENVESPNGLVSMSRSLCIKPMKGGNKMA